MTAAPMVRYELLAGEHDVKSFQCEEAPLVTYLQKHALQSQQAYGPRTYVALLESKIVGYYSLYPGSVSHSAAPPRLTKGLGKYPVGILLLTRLARHGDLKRRGVGPALLKNAFHRTLQAADLIGGRALLAHAKDVRARAFYEKFDFLPFPDDPLTLYILVKDLKAAAAREPTTRTAR